MTQFPKISFNSPYTQKGKMNVFQGMFPAKGYTTFSVFDFGREFKPMLATIIQGMGQWVFEESEFNELAKMYAKKLGEKVAFKERFGKWMQICKRIEGFTAEVNEKDLSKLSEDQIKHLFEELRKTIAEFWNYSMFTEMFDAGYDAEDLERINKGLGLSRKEIQVMITPTKPTYVKEHKQTLYDLLENPSEEKKQAFLKKFFWIKTDYTETGKYTEKDLEQELAELKKGNWEKEKQELLKFSKEIETQQSEILKSKGLEENPFWFYKELTFWRDERKRYNYMSLFAATQLALEVLKRKGFEKHLNVLMPNELFSLPKKQELEKREKNGVIAIVSGKKIELYAEPDAEEKLEEKLGNQETKGYLRGMSASIGTATGKAKIILSPKDFHKMQEGNILVAPATRPEYVPIMQKAAAIVTDEGGITCHAAIVSREFGKPCVVGTKIATKVFKDNDLLEVRANHGLVKKL